ncbi:hypothetical protein C0Q70_06302 [Pomacea canaliculata]|uniref:TIR domain-containing protein n=1 Tax=Pomacea canaliculata TaxID=400727 RepID=A0A2T7PNL9_POMCA|nr:hypothetical protein C0Q70_06302 [Pomacea canaliculata]
MCSCKVDTEYSLEGEKGSLKVNCSHLGLDALPEDIPPQTTYLVFDRNLLTHLQNYTFSYLKALKCLNLSSNMISSLEEESFADLTELQYLQLDNNRLEFTSHTFPPLVFKPLSSLLFLSLHNNTHPVSIENLHSPHVFDSSWSWPYLSPRSAGQRKDLMYRNVPESKEDDSSNETWKQLLLDYPDEALSHLLNLRTLFIDGLTNTTFGPGFKKLYKLIKLVVSGENGFCKIHSLTNKTFVNIPSLQDLDLSKCHINTIEVDSFGSLPSLVNLSLSRNSQLGLNKLFDALYGLTKTRLEVLSVSGIVPFGVPGQTITKENLRFFGNLTHLHTLSARSNRIVNFEVGALCDGVPPNLRIVYLDANWLEFTYYVHELDCLKGLEVLTVDGYDYLPQRLRIPDTKPAITNTHRCQSTPPSLTDERVNDEQEFLLPPNLKYLSLSNMGLFYILEEIQINSSNSLECLEAKGNHLTSWYGPVRGLEHLTMLNMAESKGSEVRPTFFESFPSLKVLNISGNEFREAFRADTEGKLLRRLSNLSILDISRNNIGEIPKQSFYNLENLEEIYTSQNGLGSFDVSLIHMNKLKFLDVQQNLINFFPEFLCNHLDRLAESHNVSVNMKFNPITCTCHNINFLKWKRDSKVNFGTDDNYYCLYEDGSQGLMTDLPGTITSLEQTCGGNVGAFFRLGALLLSLMTSLALALAYRFRWKLRYLYYATRLNFHRQRQSADDEFDFDAFVSFSSEDNDFVMGELRRRLENDRDVTLCIHTRDFTPGKPRQVKKDYGQYIATNVVDCVQRSRRTLVVVTRALLESDWCHYELQMALMEASHTGRHVLVFLLYEHLSSNQIPRQVLYNIQAATHIEFPHEEEDTSLFWNRLALALKA